ncbi:MAG: VanZ family protein [Bacteroidota bacterium]|nr:VanZ family protein [Bacteroidota bacterium]
MARSITFVKRSLISLLLCYGIIVLFATLYPFSFNPKNNCIPLKESGIRFSSPAIMYTDSCPDVFLKMHQFTILFRFSAESESTSAAQTIITNSINSYDQNFCIQQLGKTLVFRVFNKMRPEPNAIYIMNVVKSKKTMWCSIVYDGDVLRCYIDGVKKNERKIGAIDFSMWDRTYPLVVGSEANGYHSWDGILYSLLLYNKAIPAKDLRRPDRYINLATPALFFNFDPTDAGFIRSRGSDSMTTLYIPENFVPPQRTVLIESTSALWKRRLYLRDIIGNIIMFLPLGFLASMLMLTMISNRRKNTILVCAIGLMFSTIIELLQVYQPGRFSSISDVLSNTMGAFFGTLIFFFLLKTLKTESGITQ